MKKGFLASVRVVPIEKNYLFRQNIPKDKEIFQIVVDYAKSEIALWFHLFLENEMKITKMKNVLHTFLSDREKFDSKFISKEPDYQIETIESEGKWYSQLLPYNRDVLSYKWDLLLFIRKTTLEMGYLTFKTPQDETRQLLSKWPLFAFHYLDQEVDSF